MTIGSNSIPGRSQLLAAIPIAMQLALSLFQGKLVACLSDMSGDCLPEGGKAQTCGNQAANIVMQDFAIDDIPQRVASDKADNPE